MLALAPWMVPLGIFLVSLFLAFCTVKLDQKTDIDSELLDLIAVICLGVAVMAVGSLLTIWIL